MKSIVITGASGFIGRYILENLIEDYRIFAIARRSRKFANVPFHKNLHWLQCDVANLETIDKAVDYINSNGGCDYLIHLAAYYDFTYKDNYEYERTNVLGTKNILSLAKRVNTSRFIFASSLAACDFVTDNNKVDESACLNTEYQYAWSKKKGEILVEKSSHEFPCSVVRFAAVYSDWCEYAVLYKFLESWLSNKYYSKILGGKGESAIPYIHVHDLFLLLKKIIDKSENLRSFDIYNGSPNGCTSHQELFKIATRYYLGESVKPIFLPKFLAYVGIIFRNIISKLHLTSKEYFERLWMLKYTDLKLDIDSNYTQATLDWKPTPRYNILRRMLFLLEKMKSHPDEWKVKNEIALKKVTRRANFLIYLQMIDEKESWLDQISTEIYSGNSNPRFKRYHELSENDFHCYMSTLYHLLLAAIRSADRSLMIKYIDEIAIKRFAEGFEPKEICDTLDVFRKVLIKNLNSVKKLKQLKQDINDYIGLTIQLAQDEIEDLYENLIRKLPKDKIPSAALIPDCKELQKMIRQLSAFYQMSPESEKIVKK